MSISASAWTINYNGGIEGSYAEANDGKQIDGTGYTRLYDEYGGGHDSWYSYTIVPEYGTLETLIDVTLNYNWNHYTEFTDNHIWETYNNDSLARFSVIFAGTSPTTPNNLDINSESLLKDVGSNNGLISETIRVLTGVEYYMYLYHENYSELDVYGEITGIGSAHEAFDSYTSFYFDSAILPTEPVPEPATILLFSTALAGLASSRLRRKKKEFY